MIIDAAQTVDGFQVILNGRRDLFSLIEFGFVGLRWAPAIVEDRPPDQLVYVYPAPARHKQWTLSVNDRHLSPLTCQYSLRLPFVPPSPERKNAGLLPNAHRKWIAVLREKNGGPCGKCDCHVYPKTPLMQRFRHARIADGRTAPSRTANRFSANQRAAQTTNRHRRLWIFGCAMMTIRRTFPRRNWSFFYF